MNEPINPYQSPPSPSPYRTESASRTGFRFWYLLGSVTLFFGGPWCIHWLGSVGWLHLPAPGRRFIEIASLGGQMFLMSSLSLLLGWPFLALGWRKAAVVAGLLSMMALTAFPMLYDPTEYGRAQYWTWLGAGGLLSVGGYRLPRRDAASPRGVEVVPLDGH